MDDTARSQPLQQRMQKRKTKTHLLQRKGRAAAAVTGGGGLSVSALASVPSVQWPATARDPADYSVPDPPEEEQSPEDMESCGGPP